MGFNKKVLSKAVSELGKAKAPGKPKDIITDPAGQWKYPGQKTRIPGNDITMQGVPYPVWAQPNVGPGSMMQPNQDYNFPGASYVDETPMAKKGGTLQSKKYSKSMSATNKLFTKNKLFQNKKSKIFDPNAEFKKGGSKLGTINLNPNPLSHYELNYGFNLPTEEDGGEADYEDQDLTDEEIQAYRDGGYVVEELPYAQVGVTTNDNYFSYEGRPNAKYMKKDNDWYINTPHTNHQYIKVKDPAGNRTKILNEQAVYHSGTEAKPTSSSVINTTKNVVNPINSDILKIGDSVSGGGYNKAFAGSGTPFVISHNGQEILSAATDGTYCSGYTCGVAMKTMQERGMLNNMTPDQLKNFQKTWYGAKDFEKGKSETLSTKALEDYNLGKRIEQKEAKPGDIAQIWRNNGSGHSVIFKDWVTDDKGNVIGIKYRSSQANTKGVGDRTEMFGTKIDPNRIYVARLNDHSKGGKSIFPKKQAGGPQNTSGPRADYVATNPDDYEYEPMPEEKARIMNTIVQNAGKGNIAARRMMNPNAKSYTFTGNEYDEQMQRPVGVPAGEKGSHFSASMDKSFVPFIQEGENGNLQFNEYASSNDKEAIKFNTEKEANFFANHYKKANPPMMQGWEKKQGGFVQHELVKAQKGRTVTHTNRDDYNKAFAAEADSLSLYNDSRHAFNKFTRAGDRFNTNLNPEQWKKASNEYDKLLDLQEKKWHTFPYKNGDVSQYIPGYTANYKYKGPRSGLIIKPVGVEKFYREGYDFPKFKKPVIHNIIQEPKNEITPLKNIPYQQSIRPEQQIIPAAPYKKPVHYSGPRYGTLAGDENLNLEDDATQEQIAAARRDKSATDFQQKNLEYQEQEKAKINSRLKPAGLTENFRQGGILDKAQGGKTTYSGPKFGLVGPSTPKNNGSPLLPKQDLIKKYQQEVDKAKAAKIAEAERVRQKAIAKQKADWQQAMDQSSLKARNSNPDNLGPQSAGSADWVWTLPILGPAAAEAMGSVSAMSLPGMAAVPGATVGNAANAAFIANSLYNTPKNVGDWYDVSQGKKNWKDAALGTAEIAAGLIGTGSGAGAGFKSVAQDVKQGSKYLGEGSKTTGSTLNAGISPQLIKNFIGTGNKVGANLLDKAYFSPALNKFINKYSPLNLIKGYGSKLEGTVKPLGNVLGRSIKDGNIVERSLFGKTKNLSTKIGKTNAENIYSAKISGSAGSNVGTGSAYKQNWFNKSFNKKNPTYPIQTQAGTDLTKLPVSDPGVALHRRLPFSNRYVPIDKQKLLNNKFQWSTTGAGLQNIAEKYGRNAIAGGLGYGAYNAYNYDKNDRNTYLTPDQIEVLDAENKTLADEDKPSRAEIFAKGAKESYTNPLEYVKNPDPYYLNSIYHGLNPTQEEKNGGSIESWEDDLDEEEIRLLKEAGFIVEELK